MESLFGSMESDSVFKLRIPMCQRRKLLEKNTL